MRACNENNTRNNLRPVTTEPREVVRRNDFRPQEGRPHHLGPENRQWGQGLVGVCGDIQGGCEEEGIRILRVSGGNHVVGVRA